MSNHNRAQANFGVLTLKILEANRRNDGVLEVATQEATETGIPGVQVLSEFYLVEIDITGIAPDKRRFMNGVFLKGKGITVIPALASKKCGGEVPISIMDDVREIMQVNACVKKPNLGGLYS